MWQISLCFTNMTVNFFIFYFTHSPQSEVDSLQAANTETSLMNFANSRGWWRLFSSAPPLRWPPVCLRRSLRNWLRRGLFSSLNMNLKQGFPSESSMKLWVSSSFGLFSDCLPKFLTPTRCEVPATFVMHGFHICDFTCLPKFTVTPRSVLVALSRPFVVMCCSTGNLSRSPGTCQQRGSKASPCLPVLLLRP